MQWTVLTALCRFVSSSSMKPTKISSLPDGSLNQIPARCVIQGDIRVVPFYRIRDVQEILSRYVEELNADLASLSSGTVNGPDSKFHGGSVRLEWLGTPIDGLACNLDSHGYHSLCNATRSIFGSVSPIADTGSLPLVATLQQQGFDVQTIGYGKDEFYHGDNEQASLSDFAKGFRVISTILSDLHTAALAHEKPS
jgi:acetylornithine deacetylase